MRGTVSRSERNTARIDDGIVEREASIATVPAETRPRPCQSSIIVARLSVGAAAVRAALSICWNAERTAHNPSS